MRERERDSRAGKDRPTALGGLISLKQRTEQGGRFQQDPAHLWKNWKGECCQSEELPFLSGRFSDHCHITIAQLTPHSVFAHQPQTLHLISVGCINLPSFPLRIIKIHSSTHYSINLIRCSKTTSSREKLQHILHKT